MGPIWGVTMNEKDQRLLWDPICGYCNEWKTNDYYGILYEGIAMNENWWLLSKPYMWVLQWMCDNNYHGPICGYCIFW